VKPIRQLGSESSNYYNLNYNTVTGEVVYRYSSTPGIIQLFAGSSGPDGYLICDGSLYNATDYPNLFSVIGYTYGGSTGQFNVPNLKGRVPVGIDGSQSEFNVLGEVGGEKTHTLTINEMPAHTHSYQNQPNSHQVAVSLTTTGTADDVNIDQTTGSTGGSQAHNNLQPYIVLNYIISY
jgi:microcystin-dependent protein